MSQKVDNIGNQCAAPPLSNGYRHFPVENQSDKCFLPAKEQTQMWKGTKRASLSLAYLPMVKKPQGLLQKPHLSKHSHGQEYAAEQMYMLEGFLIHWKINSDPAIACCFLNFQQQNRNTVVCQERWAGNSFSSPQASFPTLIVGEKQKPEADDDSDNIRQVIFLIFLFWGLIFQCTLKNIIFQFQNGLYIYIKMTINLKAANVPV